MIVVTSNENKDIIDNLDIDIIKRVDGVYELRELLSKFSNLYFNKMVIDITSIANYQNDDVIVEFGKLVDPKRVIILLNNDEYINSPAYMTILINNGFYNITRNIEGIKYLYNNPNSYDDVKHLLISEEERQRILAMRNSQNSDVEENRRRKIIGISNLTNHAGATSIVNMMVRQLNNQNVKTIGIEMFRQDLLFYHDPNLSSCMNRYDLENRLKENADASVVIIDLNEFGEADRFCDDIVYLAEPSYVKITKLLRKNPNAFAEKKGEKIVLNMSFVGDNELYDFQFETKCKVFYNMPPLNDRNQNINEINELLHLLGLI